METSIETTLAMIANGQLSPVEVEALLQNFRNTIKANPASAKELGQHIYLINKALREKPSALDLNLQTLAGGYIAIGHKPGGKLPFAGLCKSGINVVVTLLQENEGAASIGQQVSKAGMQWLWLPFSASMTHDPDLSALKNFLLQVQELLAAGDKLYIHCSAGIHRTGMIAYSIMRYVGQNAEEAKRNLQQLRLVTAQQVGDDRLAWADKMINEIRNGL
jgi:protein-tyrosine phosphatase